MIVVELGLLAIGAVLFISSFFLTERLSHQDLSRLREMSEKELQSIVDSELSRSSDKIQGAIDRAVDESMEDVERALDKRTNEQIMAIDEYAGTVIGKMDRTHEEIMFLYSMLNDRRTEVGQMSEDLKGMLRDAEKLRDMQLQTPVRSTSFQAAPARTASVPGPGTPFQTARPAPVQAQVQTAAASSRPAAAPGTTVPSQGTGTPGKPVAAAVPAQKTPAQKTAAAPGTASSGKEVVKPVASRPAGKKAAPAKNGRGKDTEARRRVEEEIQTVEPSAELLKALEEMGEPSHPRAKSALELLSKKKEDPLPLAPSAEKEPRASPAPVQETAPPPVPEPVSAPMPMPMSVTVPEPMAAPAPPQDRNAQILQMKEEGMDEVSIARELSLGVGEVQLILGLARRERNEA